MFKINKDQLNFVIKLIRSLGFILAVFFVLFLNFDEEPIDKEAFLSEALDYCNHTNLQKIAPEQFLQADDIKILNESGQELKDSEGNIVTPLSQHLHKVRSSEVSDCQKIIEVCRDDLNSEACILMISKFM